MVMEKFVKYLQTKQKQTSHCHSNEVLLSVMEMAQAGRVVEHSPSACSGLYLLHLENKWTITLAATENNGLNFFSDGIHASHFLLPLPSLCWNPSIFSDK